MVRAKLKTSTIKILLVIVILVVVAVIVFKMLYRRRNKTKDQKSLNLLNGLFGTPPPRYSVKSTMGQLTPPVTDNALVYSPEITTWEEKLFPIQIKDVPLGDYEEFKNGPIYQKLQPILKKYSPPLKPADLKFLIQYKLFMDLPEAYSMAGPNEIDQMYLLSLKVFGERIPGDVVECGVWRGGMLLFLKALFDHYRKLELDVVANRCFWGFDAFGPFPPPQMNSLDLAIHPITNIMYANPPTTDVVVSNFKKFDLLDANLKLVKGEFSQTLPLAISSINNADLQTLKKIALLRIDCDYYDATYSVLENLYPLISPGGYVVIDDYNNSAVGCQQAVLNYRQKHQITNPIVDTYGGSVYWKII